MYFISVLFLFVFAPYMLVAVGRHSGNGIFVIMVMVWVGGRMNLVVVKNEWNFTFTPSYTATAWCLAEE